MDWNSLLTPLFWIQLLASAVSLATPLILAALGEVFAERSGIINLAPPTLPEICGPACCPPF